MILLLATITSTLGCLALGGYALKFNFKHSANRYFAAFCFVTALWLVFYAFSLTYLNSILLIRITIFLATLQSSTLLMFAYNFVNITVRKYVSTLYFFTAIFIGFLTLTPAVFSHTEMINGVDIPVSNYGMYFFIPFVFTSVVASMIFFVLNLHRSERIVRIRTYYILIGYALTMSIIIVTNFVGVILFHTIRFSPIGMVSTLFFVSFSAYAMTRYRFLEVRAVVKKSILYGGALLLFTFLYVVLNLLMYRSFYVHVSQLDLIIFTAFSSIVYTVLVQVLSKKIQHYLDGRFFQSIIDLVRFIDEDGAVLNSTHELESFILKLVGSIQDIIKAPVKQFFVLQKHHARYTSFFPPHSRAVIHFDEFQRDQFTHLAEPSLLHTLREEENAEVLVRMLKKFSAEIYVPIIVDDELYAFVLIGKHKNNVPFRDQDVQKLSEPQKQAAVGIQALLQWQYTVENLREHLKSQM